MGSKPSKPKAERKHQENFPTQQQAQPQAEKQPLSEPQQLSQSTEETIVTNEQHDHDTETENTKATNNFNGLSTDFDDNFFSGKDDNFVPNIAPTTTLFIGEEDRSAIFSTPKPLVFDFKKEPAPEIEVEETPVKEELNEDISVKEENKDDNKAEIPTIVVEPEKQEEAVAEEEPSPVVEEEEKVQEVKVPELEMNNVVEEQDAKEPEQHEERNSDEAVPEEDNEETEQDIKETDRDSGIDEEMEIEDEDVKLARNEFFPIWSKPKDYAFDLNLAKEVFEPLQDFVRKRGFYQAVPTLDVLQRAQKCIRLFNVKPPREDGMPLPFPFIPEKYSLYDDQTKGSHNSQIKEEFSSLIFALKKLSSSSDEINKVKVICKWMADNLDNIPVESLVNERKTISKHYFHAELFSSLCRLCGVKCIVIKGRRKTFDEDPISERLTCKAAWCLVLVKGQWRFIDASLPSFDAIIETVPTFEQNEEGIPKNMTEKRLTSLRRIFMECYYLSDQEIMINTHFPNEEYWQLLCRSVSEEEWEQSASITPFFYYLELSLQMKTSRLIRCNGHPLIMSFTYPIDKYFTFVAELYDEQRIRVPTDTAHITLEADLRIKSVTLQIYFKTPGHFLLRTFCKDLTSSENGYLLICTHDIEVLKENASSEDTVSLPPAGRQGWGPADDTLLAGISPVSHRQSVIECSNDILDLTFDSKTDDIELRFSLTDSKGVDLSRRVIHWNDNQKLYVKVNSPGNSSCVLNIYRLQYPTELSEQLICSYRVLFNTRNMVHVTASFPEDFMKLGVTKPGKALKLTPLFQPSKFLSITDETQFEFSITEDFPQRLSVTMHYLAERLREADSYTMWYTRKSSLFLTFNPTRTGYFLLKLSVHQEKGGLAPLYRALYHVEVPSSKWCSYAQKHAEAHAIPFRVISPPYSIVLAKRTMVFSYFVRDAHDVAVVTAKGWNHLTQIKNNRWEGEVETGPKGTDVKVCGRFEAGNETFTTLVIYKTITEEEDDDMARRQEKLRMMKEREYQRKREDFFRMHTIPQLVIPMERSPRLTPETPKKPEIEEAIPEIKEQPKQQQKPIKIKKKKHGMGPGFVL